MVDESREGVSKGGGDVGVLFMMTTNGTLGTCSVGEPPSSSAGEGKIREVKWKQGRCSRGKEGT